MTTLSLAVKFLVLASSLTASSSQLMKEKQSFFQNTNNYNTGGSINISLNTYTHILSRSYRPIDPPNFIFETKQITINYKTMKSRIIKDLCGNEYRIEEASDIQGKFLEVYEVVRVDDQSMYSYLFDIDMNISDSDDDILDEIDDCREKLKND